MSGSPHPIFELLERDKRYKLEAYQFVRDALAYAQDELKMGQQSETEAEPAADAHLTGQELCHAFQLFALDQFGLMARLVLNDWGVRSTGDIGEIVYNLIEIGLMKKSDTDRREDFDDVFDFNESFEREFKISKPD
jgi:uncharacterized repeat protein (TIGR04138 family)